MFYKCFVFAGESFDIFTVLWAYMQRNKGFLLTILVGYIRIPGCSLERNISIESVRSKNKGI